MDYIEPVEYMPITPPLPEPPSSDVSSDVQQTEAEPVYDDSVGSEIDVEA
ncbi:hypothetical protein WKV44_08640 [Spirochaetia bacterium 38H-sp]|uniref:Uncharacterized protein n=1 Tax=Rarispira pelagica TaxID=3141764 RepID=A0ABU9UD63_9SPIR